MRLPRWSVAPPDVIGAQRKNFRYVQIDAIAIGLYTGDLDVFVRPDPINARSIMQALLEFGFGSVGLTEADFEEEGRIVQLGVPPVRVDIITSITGVSWEKARSERVKGLFGDLPVHYIGRDDFISNKTALARKKDLADLEAVGED